MLFEDDPDPKATENTESKDSSLPQEKQDVQNVCEIDISNVFSALNKVAVENVKKVVSNYDIINTALDGEGTKAKFSGPGQHLIMALATSDEIKKDDALKAIQTYIQWFSGPENAEKLTINDIKPQFGDITEKDKEKAIKKQDDDKETQKEKKKEKESTTESIFTSSLLELLFESTQEEDQAEANENNQKIIGYFVEYEIEIGKNKGSTIDSAWKKIGKWADNITFSTRGLSYLGGNSGGSMSIGDMKKAFSSKIDAAKLATAVKSRMKADYPGLDSSDISALDTKSIINFLKTRLTAAAKAALKAVKYALCIRVNKNSKSYELVSKQDIADMVTKSMKSDKKLFGNKNKVNKNDVILVNNYKDNKEEPKTTSPKESIQTISAVMNMIFEDVDSSILSDITEAEPKKSGTKSKKTKTSKKTKKDSDVADESSDKEHDKDDTDKTETSQNNEKPEYREKSNILKKIEDLIDAIEHIDTNTAKELQTKIYTQSKLHEMSVKELLKVVDDLIKRKSELNDKLVEDLIDELVTSYSGKDNKKLRSDLITRTNDKHLQEILKQLGTKNPKKSILDYVNTVSKRNNISTLETVKNFSKSLESLVSAKDDDEADIESDPKTPLLKRLKFLIIHYCLNKLNAEPYSFLKDDKLNAAISLFDLPTNQNKIDEIAKISANKDNKKEQNAAITINKDEFQKFESYTQKDILDLCTAANVRKGKKTSASEAFQQLLNKLEHLVKDPVTDKIIDLKSINKNLVGTTEVTMHDLRDGKTNLWDQGPCVVLKIIDNVQEQIDNKKNVKKDLDSKKTEWDCYIIPMKNLDFVDAKEQADKDRA